MASTNITFDIIGRDRSGSSSFDKVAKSANRADGAMSKFSAGATKVAKAGMFALGAGAVIAAKGLYEMGQSAAADEAAQVKLAGTLRATTGATDKQIAAVERWITAQGKAFGVTDDDLRPALQRLSEATGDVAQAQDLASLAMDVSAGTGKSLKSVSEALMKAQNGQIAGLSRMGIETKNAKGETLTFEQATRKMSETFKGQAAANAETLSGKMARLKVILSEAGEEIGAKLIPYVSDAADLFVDKGVPALEAFGDKAGPVFRNMVEGAGDIKDAVQPAVEEIAEALGNLADKGGSAGHIFDDVLLPALSGTADVVAFLVDFVDDLPGPVKEVGVQAAFAAYGVGKLNSALIASKETGFIATMTDSTKRTDALRGAAKTAAGVGGILALTSALGDAKDEGSSFGDILKGAAGGAGIGAMFGPIGALVGAGAGGGLTALVGAFAETKEEAREARLELMRTEGFKDAKADAGRLSEALNGVINAYGDVSRAAVEASFYEDGKLDPAIQALRDVGVSMDTIISATMGQEKAQRIATGALDSYLGSLESAASEQQTVVDGMKASIEDYAATFSDDNAFASDPRTQAMQAELEGYQAHLDALLAEIDKVNVAQDVFGAKVDENTSAISVHEQKMLDLGEALGLTAAQYKALPQKVRTEIEGAGLPETSAGALRLIKEYKGLQRFDRIEAVVSAPGVDLTRAQVLKLQRRYDLTPKQVKTLFRSEGIPTTLRGVANLAKRYHMTPKKIATLIEAAGLPFTVRQVRNFQKDVAETDKKHAAPKFTADDRRFKDAITGATRDLADLGKREGRPSASLDLAPFFQDRGLLLTSLNTIPDEHVTVWLHHQNAGGGGGGGAGGSDNDPTTPERTLLPKRTLGRSMSTASRSFQTAAGTTYGSRSPGRMVIELRVVDGELDLSKAKAQIGVIAREVSVETFTDEFAEERRFERTQR